MPKGIVAMEDITRIEDSPGGKKSHFVIYFGQMHMHIKSDDQAVKDKWFKALQLLWQHYKNLAGDSLDENNQASSSIGPSKMQTFDSPNHYKTKKINPTFLLEIAAEQQGII